MARSSSSALSSDHGAAVCLPSRCSLSETLRKPRFRSFDVPHVLANSCSQIFRLLNLRLSSFLTNCAGSSALNPPYARIGLLPAASFALGADHLPFLFSPLSLPSSRSADRYRLPFRIQLVIRGTFLVLSSRRRGITGATRSLDTFLLESTTWGEKKF